MSADHIDPPAEQAPEQKITALQLWNAELRKHLEDHLIIRVTRNLIIPIRKHLQKAEEAIQVAERFEVTKHRVIVDEIMERIKRADDFKVRCKEDYNKTWLWQFRTRKKLMTEYVIASTSREVYQQALMVVVNTPPPLPNVEGEPNGLLIDEGPDPKIVSMNGSDQGTITSDKQ